MSLRRWNLVRDPFASGGPYVTTPAHEAAVGRVVEAIGAGGWTTLRGGAGLGKSVVLARAIRLARAPGLRVATAVGAVDDDSLATSLARSLRLASPAVATPARAWPALAEAARLIRAQRGRLLVAVDGDERAADPRSLRRLAGLDPAVSLLDLTRDEEDEAGLDGASRSVALRPLDRGEVAAYLGAKLRLAGGEADAFSGRAVSVLHAIAEGVPARVDRLAGRSLRLAGEAGLDRVDEATVEAVGAGGSILAAGLG